MPFTPRYLKNSMVPTITQVKQALKKLDHDDINSRDPRYFHAIVQALMFADAKALGVMQTRKLAVQKTPWRIGDRTLAEEDERKQYLTNLIRQSRLHQYLGSLLNARFTGAVVAEVNRDPEAEQRTIKFIDFTDIEIDYERPERVVLLDSDGANFERLNDIEQYRTSYIISTYNPMDGVKPNHRGGLMRSALPLLMLKHFDIWNWARFNELFGQPVRYGQYKADEATDDDIKKAETMLDEMGSSAWAVIPDSIKMEFVNAMQSGNIQAYKDFQSEINETIAVLLLGQSETTEQTPGRLGNDTGSEAVRSDYQEDDWTFIENVINDEFLSVEWNLKYGGTLPEEYRFTFDKEDPEDYEANANIVDVLLTNGVELVKSNVENKTGFKIADDETDESDRLSGSLNSQMLSRPAPTPPE